MTILREIKKVDAYLQGKLDPASFLIFEAQLLIDPAFAMRVECQRRLYRLIKLAGRRELKKDVERLHRHFFSDPSKADFREEILKNFPNT
jgi:hypothetical protein